MSRASTTTTTATATTTSTTTNTAAAALHRRVAQLEGALKESANLTTQLEALRGVVAAVDGVEQGLEAQIAVNAKQATTIASQGTAIATLTSQVAKLAAQMGAVLARPAAPDDPLAGGCAAGALCPPVVESTAERSLLLGAWQGTVLLHTKECGPTDLCQLSQDVAAMLEKLRGPA